MEGGNAPDERADDAGPIAEVPNAASRRGVRRQKDSAQRRAREDAESWAVIVGSQPMRRLFYQLLQSTGFLTADYPVAGNGSADVFLTGQHVGTRKLGERWYLTALRFDPEGVNLMLRENDVELIAAEKRRRH